MDVSVTFEGMSQSPLELEDCAVATDLKTPVFCQFLQKFSDRSGRFSYPKFLNYFCEELRLCLCSVSKEKVPKGLTFETDWRPCSKCQLSDNIRMIPLAHCTSCAPAVTYSKLGPCLLFTWQSLWGSQTAMSLDLIPNFYVKHQGNTSLLFQRVFASLKNSSPEGWKQHCHQISQKNRHVNDLKLREEHMFDFYLPGKVELMPLKLLNNNKHGPNYVIRPVQQIRNNAFSSNKTLRKYYILFKALKKVLRLPVSNFFIKKCHASMSETLKSDLDHRSILHHAPSMVRRIDVNSDFNNIINVKGWTRSVSTTDSIITSRYVPLTTGCDVEDEDGAEARYWKDFQHTLCLPESEGDEDIREMSSLMLVPGTVPVLIQSRGHF